MEILFLYENLLKSVCISYYFRFMRSQERKWLVENLSFVWNEQIRSYVSDGGGRSCNRERQADREKCENKNGITSNSFRKLVFYVYLQRQYVVLFRVFWP